MSAVLQPDGFRPGPPAEPVPIGRPSMLSLQPAVARAFGVEDIADAGLLAGWASSEPGHAWNDGVDATLLVATRHRPGPCDLVIEAEPYITRQNPVQEITLFANGARVGFWRLSQRQVVRMTAWIDPQWWRETHDRAALRLVFHMPQSVCPTEIGDGCDLRQLGFSFRSIVLLASRSEA
jgi:hypothetical protein